MKGNPNAPPTPCPVTTAALVAEARHRFDKLLDFCQRNDHTFWKFEQCLLALLAVLGRVLVRLFLTARHERLGLPRDRLSPWVMQLVGRLATRMSFAATRLVCTTLLRWSPATETIEQVVLGLGREAAPFMQQLAAPAADGEVLVIEEDGKCPPTATEAELAKRRGQRHHQ